MPPPERRTNESLSRGTTSPPHGWNSPPQPERHRFAVPIRKLSSGTTSITPPRCFRNAEPLFHTPAQECIHSPHGWNSYPTIACRFAVLIRKAAAQRAYCPRAAFVTPNRRAYVSPNSARSTLLPARLKQSAPTGTSSVCRSPKTAATLRAYRLPAVPRRHEKCPRRFTAAPISPLRRRCRASAAILKTVPVARKRRAAGGLGALRP